MTSAAGGPELDLEAQQAGDSDVARSYIEPRILVKGPEDVFGSRTQMKKLTTVR